MDLLSCENIDYSYKIITRAPAISYKVGNIRRGEGVKKKKILSVTVNKTLPRISQQASIH